MSFITKEFAEVTEVVAEIIKGVHETYEDFEERKRVHAQAAQVPPGQAPPGQAPLAATAQVTPPTYPAA